MTFRPKQNGGGVGLTNPMPNGTFLQTIDKDDNQINLIGYLSEVIGIGDLEFGNSMFLVSGDTTTQESTFINVSTDGFSVENIDDNVGNQNSLSMAMRRATGQFEWQNLSTDIALPNGIEHTVVVRSNLAADDDVVFNQQVYAYDGDLTADVLYSRTKTIIKDSTAFAASAQWSLELQRGGTLPEVIVADMTRQEISSNGVVAINTDLAVEKLGYFNVDGGQWAYLTQDANESYFEYKNGDFLQTTTLAGENGWLRSEYTSPTAYPNGFQILTTANIGVVNDNDFAFRIRNYSNSDTGTTKEMGNFNLRMEDVSNGSEDSYYSFASMNAGTLTESMRVRGNGVNFLQLPKFNALPVTGGIAYAEFETSLGAGTYAFQFGAGTTVPTDATVGWSGGAIFGDADATPNTYNRIWLNTGSSASSAFRRIAIVENTNQMAMADGTAAAPFYSFPSSLDTGIYLPSANTLGFATNGILRLQVNGGLNIQFNLPTSFGSSTAPSAATYGHGRVGSTVLQANVGSGGTHGFSVNGQTRFAVNNIGELTNVEDAITASATQTQGQRPLLFSYNIVTTVAAANNVVTLPTAVGGQIVRIKNEGANTLQVFPASGDSVNNLPVNTSVTQATNTFFMYIADDATNWTRVQMTIA